MTGARMTRLVGGLLGTTGVVSALALAYFGLTSPALPYTKYSLYYVDRLTDPARAGEIQAGDEILSFNGEPVSACMYLVDSPIYRAPRGRPIPIEYRRPIGQAWAFGTTSVVLEDPSIRLILTRGLTHLIALAFVVTALVILLGAAPSGTNLLLGLASLTSGLVIAAGPDISDFQAPLSLFFWLGLPVWAVVLVVAHALWPVNQLRRPGAKAIIGLVALVSLAHFVVNLLGEKSFGCYRNEAIMGFASWSYLLNVTLPFPAVLYLLFSAHRLTTNPLSRLQIRAIIWAVVLGFGIPLTLSIIPQYLNLQWVAPIEITLLLAGIISLTYLFVLYRGDLLVIDRYLNRLVFSLLFLVIWGMSALVVANGLTYWIPDPDPLLVATLASIPPLLGATWLRDRLGPLVDLALHGTHYDYEAVIARIGQALAGVRTEGDLAEVATKQLTQALSIRNGSIWVTSKEGWLRPLSQSDPTQNRDPDTGLPLEAFPDGKAEVQILNPPLRMADDAVPWRALVRLHYRGELFGILLLGEKQHERVYSEKDVRVLEALSGWMATSVANLQHLARQQIAAERERRLMLDLVENEERLRTEVAAELHDRGISSLGMVRLMVEQDRGKRIVTTALERVIGDLRQISGNRLNPAGLDQGLPQALEALVATERELGLRVSLRIADDFLASGRLSSSSEQELFYIAQEAVVNAARHSSANQIEIRLSRPNGTVRLAIRDDGMGFDRKATDQGSEIHGLRIMQARATRIGGKLIVDAAQGRGTVIQVEVDPESLVDS